MRTVVMDSDHFFLDLPLLRPVGIFGLFLKVSGSISLHFGHIKVAMLGFPLMVVSHFVCT